MLLVLYYYYYFIVQFIIGTATVHVLHVVNYLWKQILLIYHLLEILEKNSFLTWTRDIFCKKKIPSISSNFSWYLYYCCIQLTYIIITQQILLICFQKDIKKERTSSNY